MCLYEERVRAFMPNRGGEVKAFSKKYCACMCVIEGGLRESMLVAAWGARQQRRCRAAIPRSLLRNPSSGGHPVESAV